MDLEDLTCIIADPLGPNFKILVPTPEDIAELCGAIDAAFLQLDDQRQWQPVDAFPPDSSGTFVVL